MRRQISLFLIIAVLFSFTGCTSETSQIDGKIVHFYYQVDPVAYNSEAGVIAPEKRTLDNNADTLETLLSVYFSGPVERDFASPFPEGLYAQSIAKKGNRLQLTLSSVFSQLNGLDLTLACVCIGKTVMEYADVDYVYIVFESSSTGKRNTVTIGPNSYLLIDDSYATIDKDGTQ